MQPPATPDAAVSSATDGPVCTITLHRAAQRNAVDGPTAAALRRGDTAMGAGGVAEPALTVLRARPTGGLCHMRIAWVRGHRGGNGGAHRSLVQTMAGARGSEAADVETLVVAGEDLQCNGIEDGDVGDCRGCC